MPSTVCTGTDDAATAVLDVRIAAGDVRAPSTTRERRRGASTTTTIWSPPTRLLELVGRAAFDDEPVVDDHDVVGEPVGLVEVLGGEQRRRPAATSSSITSHIASRLRGSRPVVGSSRKSTDGRPIRLMAMSSRRRMPPE